MCPRRSTAPCLATAGSAAALGALPRAMWHTLLRRVAHLLHCRACRVLKALAAGVTRLLLPCRSPSATSCQSGAAGAAQ